MVFIQMQPRVENYTATFTGFEHPFAREEYDGYFLHSDVVSFDNGFYLLTYDHMLGRLDFESRYRGHDSDNNSNSTRGENSDYRYRERSVKGIFDCPSCRSHRVWTSSVISTEIWFSETTERNTVHDDSRKRNGRKRQSCSYRVRIHSQKCRDCKRYVEPKIDVDDFSRKVILAFDLWMGNREAETEPEDDYHPTRPHAANLCHGCEIGVCREGKREKAWYHGQRRKSPVRSSRYD